MKPSHRKDVIIARIIFAFICVALIAVITAIIVTIVSHNKSNVPDTETQTESQKEEAGSSYVPNDTQTVETEIHYMTTSSVNLRQEPSTEAAVVTTIPENTEVKYISEDNGWTQVDYQGQAGYIKSEFLTQTQSGDASGSATEPTQQATDETAQ